MASHKTLGIIGAIIAVVGAIIFIISLAALPQGLTKATDNAILENIVVSSSDSKRYNDWIGGTSQENEYIQYYYAYNLTNPSDVMQGKTPIYTQLGPFNYRYYWNYQDVSFTDGGKQATYSQLKYYVFNNATSALPESTLITNINPAFIGLITQVPSGNVLVGLSIGPMINYMLTSYLNTDAFYYAALGYSGATSFTNALNNLVASGVDVNDFYNAWGNSTTVPTTGNATLWVGMLPTVGVNQTALGLSNQTVQNILVASNQYAITNLTSGFPLWYQAYMLNATAVAALAQGLAITPAQVNQISVWYYETFGSIYSLSDILQRCNTEEEELIGLCQLMTSLPLNGLSVTELNGVGQPFTSAQDGAIEINDQSPGTLNMTVGQLYNYLYTFGANSLSTLTGTQALSSGANPWNMTANDLGIIQNYFGYLDGTSYLTTKVGSLMENALFTTKSVSDWLWQCNDPILEFLGTPVPCQLQQNNTLYAPTTIYTGKGDADKTNYLIKWRNMTAIPFWNPPVPVQGYAETGQFGPNQGFEDTLEIFEENVFRPLTLQYSDDTTVQDIKTKRYYLQNNSFPASSQYLNQYDGMCNLTPVQNGVPTFVTLWDMYEVPANITSQTIGQNSSYENAAVPLDLEPISGNALFYNLKLQLNFQLGATGSPVSAWDQGAFGLWNNIPNYIFLPSWKIGQTAVPSDDTINNLKEQLKQIRAVKIVPVVVFAILGALMFVIGAFVALRNYRKHKAHAHDEHVVNEEASLLGHH